MAFGSSNDSQGGVGIATTDYAQRTRLLIKLMTELRALGAQADFDLPRIAVIGNQSAGKSSLVEAISGITVPRASGTCTRCPMECRLQNSPGPWKCQVLLRIEKDQNGQRLPDVQETKFGPLVTDKSELEDMLRRAQLAILNPSISPAIFEDFDTSQIVPGQPPAGSTKLLQFSSNVVCLDLSGPDIVDLSFIDLPGIISNVADGEDRNNIELVKGLVEEHIKGNALILLTLTMRDDLENQSAAFLAKEADPEGMRTIGVLTKADAILPGEEPSWLEVLEGTRHPLKHGYYVTKQPGPDELTKHLTFEGARERERSFFANTGVWNSASGRVKSRTGIPSLTKELSKLLSQLIMQTLPKLRKDAHESYNDISQELTRLPPALSDNPAVELLGFLTAFSNEANGWINGREQHEALLQVFRSASSTFKINILQTAPNLRPFESAEAEAEAEEGYEAILFHTRIEDDPPLGTSGEHISNLDSSPMYLPQVREFVRRSLTRQLPYNIPYSAKRGLIDHSFSSWKRHATAYFETICQVTIEQLNVILEDHFARFSMSPLRDHVQKLVEEHVNNHRTITLERIAWFLELESPPFTQNDHYFSSLRQKYLSKYSAVRTGPVFNDFSAAAALSALAQMGFTGLKSEDLHKLNPPDKYEEELTVMAEVSAYFRIAYKRVIDDIPRIVDHDFLHALGKGIQSALVVGVGIGSEKGTERAAMYLSEDPDISMRREDLLGKKQRLDEVQKRLFNFGM